jgi:basic membrane lipoprotein Med (substrate-binding protein (PBP1-ABC) superfamily)
MEPDLATHSQSSANGDSFDPVLAIECDHPDATAPIASPAPEVMYEFCGAVSRKRSKKGCKSVVTVRGERH